MSRRRTSDSLRPVGEIIATVGNEIRSTSTSASASQQQAPTSSLAAVRELTLGQKLAAVPPSSNVDVWLNVNCVCGPYLDAKKLSYLPRVYRGNMVVVLQSVLEGLIKCAYDPKTVLGFLKPGRGNCIITAVCDHVTYKCCLNHIDRVSTFWNVLEQFVENLRCCPNLITNAEIATTCPDCSRLSGSVVSSHASPTSTSKILATGATASVGAPAVHAVSSVFPFESPIPLPVHLAEAPCGPPAKKPKVNNTCNLSSSPRSWSVRQVVEFIETTDLRDYADKFQINDIDGKALLLLRRELIIDCMGFKLGPAVKLMELIDELKAVEQHM